MNETKRADLDRLHVRDGDRERRSSPVFQKLLQVYGLAVALVLAYYWLKSGLAHLANPNNFLSSIYAYELVNPWLGWVAAMALPSLQLVLASCLVFRRFVGGAMLVGAALLGVFTLAQASALARGLQIGCGCFGAAEHQAIDGRSLALASSLLFCSLTGCLCWLLAPSHDPSRADAVPCATALVDGHRPVETGRR